MSEFKGTKGEWKYEVKYGKNKPRITVQIPLKEKISKELILGTINEEDCTFKSCCCTEEHANALLISKAPEMLEQLKNLRNAILSDDYVRILAESQKTKELINEATNLND